MNITTIASSSTTVTRDTVIDSIHTGLIGPRNISYPLIRRIGGRDQDSWGELDRGRAILTSIKQLDQYLFSYGPMTKGQWDQVLPGVHIPAGKVQIIDYGCGQGLASAMLFDHFGQELPKRVSRVTLVERSRVALARAASILNCYAQGSDVRALNKCLDDLSLQDLMSDADGHFIHLLSNVLDMDSFDHIELLSKILKMRGSHTILCISHNRNFRGGSNRFHEIFQILNDSADQSRYIVQQSTLRTFRCSPKGHAAISLQLCVEVRHGSV